jgi:hypothetical protein
VSGTSRVVAKPNEDREWAGLESLVGKRRGRGRGEGVRVVSASGRVRGELESKPPRLVRVTKGRDDDALLGPASLAVLENGLTDGGGLLEGTSSVSATETATSCRAEVVCRSGRRGNEDLAAVCDEVGASLGAGAVWRGMAVGRRR